MAAEDNSHTSLDPIKYQNISAVTQHITHQTKMKNLKMISTQSLANISKLGRMQRMIWMRYMKLQKHSNCPQALKQNTICRTNHSLCRQTFLTPQQQKIKIIQ